MWKSDVRIHLERTERHVEYTLTKECKPGQAFRFYLEMAANGLFGVGQNNDINPPNMNASFILKMADIVVPNPDAWAVLHDLQILNDIARNFPNETSVKGQARRTANSMINMIERGNNASLVAAHSLAKEFFKENTGHHQHQFFAVGHCHIGNSCLFVLVVTQGMLTKGLFKL